MQTEANVLVDFRQLRQRSLANSERSGVPTGGDALEIVFSQRPELVRVSNVHLMYLEVNIEE